VAWRRIDWIGLPERRGQWWHSHAAFPTVVEAVGDCLTVLVSSRDTSKRSSCAVIMIRVSEHSAELVDFSRGPLLKPGGEGHFDCDGVNVTSAYGTRDDLTVWYHGWSLTRNGGWLNSIGSARGSLTTGFVRTSLSPSFDRSPEDPTSIGYPFWFPKRGAPVLYYCSYEKFGNPSLGEPYSYRVKCATGKDLSRGAPLLRHDEGMSAQSRPCVVERHGEYLMFVAVKGSKYHIRCANSNDGVTWQWADKKWWLVPSGESNEKTEVAYPYVTDHQGRLLMLYNGDSHGKDGIGLAVWDD
jgi:hypothetical protein